MGKHLSQEEKDEIVRLHIEDDRSTRGLASEFGISRGAILNWICAARSRQAKCKLASRRTSMSHKEVDKLIKELKMQVAVMQAFLREYERWDARR